MIRDGRMPCPEDARDQLEERLRRDRLGEPMPLLGEPMPPLAEPMDIVPIPRRDEKS